MSETITVSDALEDGVGRLDSITKELYRANEDEEKAEEVWEQKLDEVAEDLENEARDEGRKTMPSEARVLSTARRRFRNEYHAWRRAKRRRERAEKMSANRRAQVSALQTMFNNLGAEAQVQDYLSQRDGS